MSRKVLLLPVLMILVVLAFAVIADRAIVEQGRSAVAAARAEADETARLGALSIRAALARHELAIVADRPLPGATVYRLVLSPRQSIRPGASRAYGDRPAGELLGLVKSSIATTPQGLPEAVVAALALGAHDAKTQAAERLLSGQLPVHPDDLDHLARALEIADERVALLAARLRAAPTEVGLRPVPDFLRSLADRGTVEGWSISGGLGLGYEVSIEDLLSAAEIPGRIRPVVGEAPDSRGSSPSPFASVPDLPGLHLEVAPQLPRQWPGWILRAFLWVAVITSILGLVVAVRAVRREAAAVSREKAFLSSVTHELRTPLAAIRLFGETLSQDRGDPREYGTLVAQESERLEALVERVLAVTRTEEAPTFARLQPAEIVDSVVRLMATPAQRKAVTLDWRPPEPVASLPEVLWDGDAVRQALVNLVDNALKHGKPGGTVVLRAEEVGACLTLSVADDGPGISRRDRKRIFGRFERGDNGTAGTGLGLFLAEQVALAHGGRVDLETKQDQGCRFSLVLPILPPEAERGALMDQPK